MRVGLTGASGFIATALARALTARGDDVVRFVRPESPPTDGPTIRWNPSRGVLDESDARRVGVLDAVVNLAGAGIGEKRWSEARRDLLRSSRLSATDLIVGSLATLGAATLLNGSAIGYYGSRGDEILDEASSPGQDFLAQLCVDWEAAAGRAPASVRVAHLRTGIVLDVHGGALARQLPLFRLGLGGRLGSGRQWLSPISLADEVRAILWVLDHELRGPVNLTAPTPLTNVEFTRVLGSALRRPAVLAVPRAALSLALGRGLTDGALLASQRVVPTRLLESGFTFDGADARLIVAAALARSN
ncbi:MAG TPA: TIGR01777 family oxidoreductase [Acidimicrobiales bacterium]|nr:TIGR01777 family oxidoreductase [Acidimicrobiales bacterium]